MLFKTYLQSKLKSFLYRDKKLINRLELSQLKELHFYGEVEKIQITDANHLIVGTEEIPEWKRDFKREFFLNAPFYVCLNNVVSVGKFGTLVWDKKIILESTLSSKGYLFRNIDWKGIFKSFFINPTKEIEWGFSLANCLANSYFHFVAETLPNIQALLEFEKNNPNIQVKIIVNSSVPEFVYQYLELFNIQRNRIIELSDKNISIKNMVVASNRFYILKNPHDDWNRHLYSKNAFDFLNKQLKSIELKKPFRKVYISRADAPGRKITNEIEIVEQLLKNGFEIHQLSSLSVEEQIELFSETKILICPHGAGMVNTIFSPSMKLIEFYPKNRAFEYNYHFYQTSNYANHQHIMILSECDSNENLNVSLSELHPYLEE